MIVTKHYGGRRHTSFEFSSECDGWCVYPYLLNNKKSIARHVIREAKKIRLRSPEYQSSPYTFVMFDTAGDYCGPMPEKPILFRASPYAKSNNQFPFPYFVETKPVVRGKKRRLISFCGAYTSKIRRKHCEGLKKILGKEFALVVRDSFHCGCSNSDHEYEFDALLRTSTFTFAPAGYGPSAKRMYSAMASSSIPVIPIGTPLPFPSLINWDRAVVQYSKVEDAASRIRSMSVNESNDMADYCYEVFCKHFTREVVLQSVNEELKSLKGVV